MARRSPPRPTGDLESIPSPAYLDLGKALKTYGYEPLAVYGDAKMQPRIAKVSNRLGVVMYMIVPEDNFSYDNVLNGLYQYKSVHPPEIAIETLERIEIPRAELAIDVPSETVLRYPVLTYEQATGPEAMQLASQLRSRLVNVAAEQEALAQYAKQLRNLLALHEQVARLSTLHPRLVEGNRAQLERTPAVGNASKNLSSFQMMDEIRCSLLYALMAKANQLNEQERYLQSVIAKLQNHVGQLGSK